MIQEAMPDWPGRPGATNEVCAEDDDDELGAPWDFARDLEMSPEDDDDD